jgi:Ca2+-transporting ATPase
VFANVFLSLVNRSFVYSVLESLKNNNKLFPIFLSASLVLLLAILYIPAFASFFQVRAINLQELTVCLFIAFASVMWVELYKWIKRKHLKNGSPASHEQDVK